MSHLRSAVSALRQEERQLEANLAKVREALAALTETESRRPGRPAKKKATRKRKPLTAAQKKAISRRMKASWAKRKKKAKAA